MIKAYKKVSPILNGFKAFGSIQRPTVNVDKEGTSEYYMGLEYDYGCHNYAPIPVVLTRGEGIHVWDVEGKQYIDCLSAYSAVNQGHCHPRIYKALVEQAQKLTLSSRAFYTDQLGITEKFLANTFGYQRVLLMNGGVESGESAIKIARRWAYTVKNIPSDKATVLFAKKNFWGRTIAACASSDDPSRYENFGPFGGLNFELIEYNNLSALEEKFKANPNICAYMVEPIQGEAGVIIPNTGYLRKVKQLCDQYNVLLICDEVQTGLGRTGKMLCSDWDEVKPDILCLGKAITGGFYPVSAVLCNSPVMDVIKPGDHGSTYGGNPLGAAVTREAVSVLIEEGMIENSYKLGKVLFDELKSINHGAIKEVRGGKGLFAAIEFHEDSKFEAIDLTMKMKDNGLLAKPTHGTTIRLAPPLCINEAQLEKSIKIITDSINSF